MTPTTSDPAAPDAGTREIDLDTWADGRDPYAEGSDAHAAGRSEAANPYDPVTDEEGHMAWNDGWSAAVEAATDDATAPTPSDAGRDHGEAGRG